MFVKQSRWAYLAAVVYGIHLLEEYFAPPGLWLWVETHFRISFSHFHWLAVNSVFFAVFLAAVLLVARGVGPAWLAVAVALHLGLHSAMHLAHSLVTWQYSPGLVTSLVLCLRMAYVLMSLALPSASPRSVGLGAAAGIATFPPLIHAAVLIALAVA